MLKKLAIVCVIPLVAGAAGLGWVVAEERREHRQAISHKVKRAGELGDFFQQYNQWIQQSPEEREPLPWGLGKYGKQKTQAQLQLEQEQRLRADLDKLATHKMGAYPFADVYYGPNWREELSKYKKRKELRESVLTGSIVSTCTGGSVLSFWLLLCIIRLVSCVPYYLKKSLTAVSGGRGKTADEQEGKAQTDVNKESPKSDVQSGGQPEQKEAERGSRFHKHPKVLINSGWQSFEQTPGGAATHQEKPRPESTEKVASSLSDGKYGGAERAGVVEPEGRALDTMQPSQSTWTPAEPGGRQRDVEPVKQTVGSVSYEQNVDGKELVEMQGEEPRNMKPAWAVRQAVFEHSEPFRNSLKEITEQISAIREYASHQQNRIEKLQDGYDWNIIRTFCLKIIRCIDNLETRIEQLSEDSVDRRDLEEIRDELIFALESSGVERFEPEINSDYRGQEKNAEAVKDKEDACDPKMTGKIAKVVRPGYQHVVGEANVKTVRAAQVRLFG